MRTALETPQTQRARIRDILVSARVRTADLVACVNGLVATSGLAAINPATFGAYNGAAGTDVASITAGATVLTSPDNPWTTDDVGKAIDVAGAGTAGGTLHSVIAGFTSAGSVTLRDAAVVTVTATVTAAVGLAIWGFPTSLALQPKPLMGADGSYLHSLTPPVPGGAGRQVGKVLGDVVNVLDFRAIGDGINDDTAAIQAAINSGKPVYFPAGTYAITKLLVTVSLFGDGSVSTLRCTSDGAGWCALAVPDTATDIELRDFKLTGAVATEMAGPSPLRGIVVGTNAAGTAHSASVYDARISIRNVTITGQSPGVNGFNVCIQTNLGRYVDIEDCRLESIYGTNSGFGHGIVLNGQYRRVANNFIVSTIAGQGRHAIYSTDTPQDQLIVGNICIGFQSEGFSSNTAGLTTDRNVCVIGNQFINCVASNTGTSASAIGMYGILDAKIIGNTVRGSNRHGIGIFSNGVANNGDRCQVIGNNVSGVARHGIYMSSDYCVVAGNIISSVSQESAGIYGGVELLNADYCRVNQNTINAASARFGIRLNASAPVPVGGNYDRNTISGSPTYPIENNDAWTSYAPQLAFGGGSIGMAGSFGGRYQVRDGHCTVVIDITLTAKGSSTGNATISLPVAAGASGVTQVVLTNESSTTFTGIPAGYLLAGASALNLSHFASGGSAANRNEGNFTNTSTIRCYITYPVDS